MFLQISFSFFREGEILKNTKSNELRSIGPFLLFYVYYDEIFDVLTKAHVSVSWNIDKPYALWSGVWAEKWAVMSTMCSTSNLDNCEQISEDHTNADDMQEITL